MRLFIFFILIISLSCIWKKNRDIPIFLNKGILTNYDASYSSWSHPGSNAKNFLLSLLNSIATEKYKNKSACFLVPLKTKESLKRKMALELKTKTKSNILI